MAFPVSSFTLPLGLTAAVEKEQDWILSFSALCLYPPSPWLLTTVSPCPELKWVQRGKVRGQKGLVSGYCPKLAPGLLGLDRHIQGFLVHVGHCRGFGDAPRLLGTPGAVIYGSALAGRLRGSLLSL